GKEIACFMSAFPVAAGIDESPFYELGLNYGIVAQVFSDYFDIWGNAISDDLISLKKSLPLYSAITDFSCNKQIRILLSGKNDLPSKQFDLRRFLTRTNAIEEFEEFINKYNLVLVKLFNSINKNGGLYKAVYEIITSCQIMISTLKEI